MTPTKTLKVDIWSDVMCPFCYIGKKKLEDALAKIEDIDSTEIVWHSFQLDPEMSSNPGVKIHEYLAARKGWSHEHALSINTTVEEMGLKDGIKFDFARVVLANSYDAHRLLHLARKFGKQNQMEELLFQAYFRDGKDLANFDVLKEIGLLCDIPLPALDALFSGDMYSEDVRKDIEYATKLGIRGVPFFVFNEKLALSGAQDVRVFVDAIKQASDLT